MNIYKQGSKLAAVYDVFLSSGIEAAFAKGIEIGLAASTLKIQVKRKNWGGDAAIAIPGAMKAAVPITSTRKRYKLSPNGTRHVVVIHDGEEQSFVKFMDDSECQQWVPNSWLIAL